MKIIIFLVFFRCEKMFSTLKFLDLNAAFQTQIKMIAIGQKSFNWFLRTETIHTFTKCGALDMENELFSLANPSSLNLFSY